MKGKILAILAFLSLLVIMPLASAEIIWSLPTGVPFYISGNNTYENQTLIVNVINPQNKVYSCAGSSLDIPLEIRTNLNASCYYSLDNSAWIDLGRSTHFSRTLTVPKGNHQLVVWCRAGNQESIKTVNFSVKSKSNETFSDRQLTQDQAYEESIRQIKYGEWRCITNRLQRTVTINNLEQMEYGQVCGLELNPSDENTRMKNILWIIPIIFFILILMVIILIALLMSRDQ